MCSRGTERKGSPGSKEGETRQWVARETCLVLKMGDVCMLRINQLMGKLIMLGRGERGIQSLTYNDCLSIVKKENAVYMNTEATTWYI